MRLFPFLKKKQFFIAEVQQRIVDAIRQAEQMTSGEVRVFVENHCSYMDALDRAAELFFQLKMDMTRERNGVIVYVALKDHQLAILGDEGIHKKVGNEFWNAEVQKMISNFNREDYAEGIRQVVLDIGEALQKHFPYQYDSDKNELPDELVFGN
jgi:uncharacterized membrane protein